MCDMMVYGIRKTECEKVMGVCSLMYVEKKEIIEKQNCKIL